MTQTVNTTLNPNEVHEISVNGDVLGYPPPIIELGSIAMVGEVVAEPPIEPIQRVGVLKKVSFTDEDRAITRKQSDGLELKDDEHDLKRMITGFAGKKNKSLHGLLKSAVAYISQNPQGDGSVTIRGLDKGQATPMYNHERIKLWRFKPDEAIGLPNNPALRTVRIVYAIVEHEGEKALGIVDIINRGDFGKKYV